MANSSRYTLEDLDKFAVQISSTMKKPLLIMYYHENGGIINDDDVADLYNEFRARGWTRSKPVDELYVLLHSYGGDPNASYRLAQVIRDFAKRVTFLIPFHATSGATLICLSANSIMMGAYATLGAIDITVGDIELASIEYFRKFVLDTRKRFEDTFSENPSVFTDMDSDMMVEMVKQVKALDIGALYRQITLTGHYAYKLLADYMFANVPNRYQLAGDIANKLLRELPAHDFVLDYHMCLQFNLPVEEMSDTISETSKQIVKILNRLTLGNIICKDLPPIHGSDYKAPFLRLYDHNATRKGRNKRTNNPRNSRGNLPKKA